MDLIILDYTLSSLLSLSLQYTATYIYTKRKESIVTLYHLHLDPWPLYNYTHICMCTISKCTEFKLPPLHGNKLLLQTKQAYQTCIHSLHTIAKNTCITLSCLSFLKKFLVNQDQKSIPTIGKNLFQRKLYKRVALIRFESS